MAALNHVCRDDARTKREDVRVVQVDRRAQASQYLNVLDDSVRIFVQRECSLCQLMSGA